MTWVDAAKTLPRSFFTVERPDLLCRRRSTEPLVGLVLRFIEVKTRSSTAFGHPFEAITTQKLARLKRLAHAWCEAHPHGSRGIRIDAIAVIAATDRAPVIEHLRRVF